MYTQLGYGDPATWGGRLPYNEKRRSCKKCERDYDDSDLDYSEDYCSGECWHLSNLGFVAKTARDLLSHGNNPIEYFNRQGGFSEMTDATVGRFKSVIKNREVA